MALRAFLGLMWKDAFWVSVLLNKPPGFVLGLFLPIPAVLGIILELMSWCLAELHPLVRTLAEPRAVLEMLLEFPWALGECLRPLLVCLSR